MKDCEVKLEIHRSITKNTDDYDAKLENQL